MQRAARLCSLPLIMLALTVAARADVPPPVMRHVTRPDATSAVAGLLIAAAAIAWGVARPAAPRRAALRVVSVILALAGVALLVLT